MKVSKPSTLHVQKIDLWLCYSLFEVPGKILSRPFWCTVLLQYVYKWLITQAMANWVTIDIVQNERLIAENILSFVSVETVNCSLSKQYFGNVLYAEVLCTKRATKFWRTCLA